MSNIDKLFSDKKAFVAYLTAGDGGYQHSLAAATALINGGVDILEVGVPFSDPVADGTTIQQASQRALTKNFSLNTVLKLVKDIRQQTATPIVLFSYYNPIYVAGSDFYAKAKQAGVDGILVVDLPLEESKPHIHYCQQHEIDPIFLISPSTPESRIKPISQMGKGMLYYVCRNGTTGIKNSLPDDFAEKMQKIRCHTQLPVITGFGISNKTMAAEALKQADGFVVGSLFVKKAAEMTDLNDLTKLANALDPR